MSDRNTTFILKRSNVLGKVPTIGQLKIGELALNTAEARAYTPYTGGFSGATGIREIGWNRVSISGDTLLGKLEYNSNLSPFTGNEIPSAQWVVDQVTGTTTGLGTKSNFVSASGFTGNPKKATVVFTTPYPNTNFSVTVTGEVSRSWSIENKTISGFTINANANLTFLGDVFWQTITYGES